MTDHGGFVPAAAAPAAKARAACLAFGLPIGLLAASALLIRSTPPLPDVLAPLRLYGPYLALGAALIVGLAFKRGRALFAVLTLLLAYAGFQLFLAEGLQGFPARTVYAALWLFVPFNLALLSALPERGALNVYGARRLILLLIELSATAAILAGDYHQVTGALYRPLLGSIAPAPHIPQLGLAADRARAGADDRPRGGQGRSGRSLVRRRGGRGRRGVQRDRHARALRLVHGGGRDPRCRGAARFLPHGFSRRADRDSRSPRAERKTDEPGRSLRPRHDRRRPFQAFQRQLGARGRRPGAQAGGVAPAASRRRRQGLPLRGRRVHDRLSGLAAARGRCHTQRRCAGTSSVTGSRFAPATATGGRPAARSRAGPRSR